MSSGKLNIKLFDKKILKQASIDSFKKLNPLYLLKNPVIFMVGIGAALTSAIFVSDIFSGSYS